MDNQPPSSGNWQDGLSTLGSAAPPQTPVRPEMSGQQPQVPQVPQPSYNAQPSVMPMQAGDTLSVPRYEPSPYDNIHPVMDNANQQMLATHISRTKRRLSVIATIAMVVIAISVVGVVVIFTTGK